MSLSHAELLEFLTPTTPWQQPGGPAAACTALRSQADGMCIGTMVVRLDDSVLIFNTKQTGLSDMPFLQVTFYEFALFWKAILDTRIYFSGSNSQEVASNWFRWEAATGSVTDGTQRVPLINPYRPDHRQVVWFTRDEVRYYTAEVAQMMISQHGGTHRLVGASLDMGDFLYEVGMFDQSGQIDLGEYAELLRAADSMTIQRELAASVDPHRLIAA